MSDALPPPTVPVDDIFAFCNHVAWQVGGPVLIHDNGWGVVAYSTLNQALDEARRAIILRRAVSDPDIEEQVLNQIKAHIDAGEEAFEMPAIPGFQERRIVAPVRVLGVVVGTIWIAESAGQLHPDAEAMARQAAKQASFYFQLHDDARRREADRFARMVLEGSQDESLLAQYLGVPGTANFRVVAVRHGHDAELRDQARHVARVLAGEQGVDHLILDGEDALYVAFYVPQASPDLTVAVRAFSHQMSAADDRLLVGAGRVTTRLAHAPKSRSDAEKVIAYLRRTPGQRIGSVNTLRTQMSLLRLVEILDAQFESPPSVLQGLSSLEPEDRADALRTLDAYFTHPGNASDAARLLLVHPNTFRYRLAKVADILGINLDDRDTRLLLEIDLLRHRYGDQRPH